MTILGVMRDAITEPGEMSPFAPRIITLKVPVTRSARSSARRAR